MSPKQRFVMMLEPEQLAALKAIEDRTGARISEQVRRAVDAYLERQTVLTRAELRKLQKG
jgi:hypothetical protein